MDSSMTDVLCYLTHGRVQDLCGRILSSLERREDRSIPMMAVAVQNRHYVLLYNPDWIAKAHYDDVVMTVRHEAYHLIFEHIPRHLEIEASLQSNGDAAAVQSFHLVTPFASDMAVNSLLLAAPDSDYMRTHADEWVLPGAGAFTACKPKRSYERYVKDLLSEIKHPDSQPKVTMQTLLAASGFGNAGNSAQENNDMFRDARDVSKDVNDEDKDGDGTGKGKKKKGGKPKHGGGTGKEKEKKESASEQSDGGTEDKPSTGLGFALLQNHRGWNDQELQEALDSKIGLADELRYQSKALVKHAVDAHTKGRGTIPGELNEVIEKLLREPQVPWTRVFRNIAANAKRTRRRRTIGRPRRRHIAVPELIPFPGKKKDYSYHVAFLIDTSASMSRVELQMALNELEGMRKIDKEMTITVIEADAAVERVYELGSENAAVKYDLHGRGGTSFDPALQHVKTLSPKPDAVFYFTDGGAPAPHKDSRVPCFFAWVLTPHGHPPDSWGVVIKTTAY